MPRPLPPAADAGPRLLAHSLPDRPEGEWESLRQHARAVAALAARHASAFGCEGLARAAGLLHDLGKASDEFQRHVRRPQGAGRGPDHSTAGARQAFDSLPLGAARWLAPAIAGHHGGLPDAGELRERLGRDGVPEWRRGLAEVGPLPPAEALSPTKRFHRGAHPAFAEAFLVRMLFSCLVDADRRATREFYDGREERRFLPLAALRARLAVHAETLGGRAAPEVDALRREVLGHATGKAALPPGLFTLTVPTGGGKTLASLSFALEHALAHGLRRAVFVIPFTSIVEQTADVFRRALAAEAEVLEHHSAADWGDEEADDGEAGDGLAKLRRAAAEDWDAPVVVTTAVQFFESLFSNRPSRCRKLHNLSRAVIVLDEAQTLPLPLLRPCLAALDELARNYGSSVVLCTATQPALRVQDGFRGGLDIPPERELAPDPPGLYAALRRVRVEVRRGAPVLDEEVATRFAGTPQILCVANSRAHARALFEAVRGEEGAAHLSTLMCPAHRRAVLAEARARLAEGLPVRLVSTSLIEAGVDVDFPEVWRAAAGLDSVAQAAGRCNRNGKLPGAGGRVVVFEPEARWKPPRELEAFWQAARPVLARHADDLLGLDAVRAYFSELYWQKGEQALDAAEVAGIPGVLEALRRHHQPRSNDPHANLYPFRSVAEAFRIIDDALLPVVVPLDDAARAALARLRASDRPALGGWRRLQAYTVGVPRRARDAWLAAGALSPAHPAAPDGPLAFADDAHYRPDTGLDIEALGLREAAANIL